MPRNVKLHADSNGNAIVLWTLNKPHTVIQTTVLPNEGAWTPITEFEIQGVNCENPKFAMNNSGNAVLIWSTVESGVRKLYGASYTLSINAWSSPEQITSNKETVIDEYEVKLLDNEMMFITWNSHWDRKKETTAHVLVNTLGKWKGARAISK
ncbi:hypothetical protein [Parachlamydia sp. AcF125]|uniref:hypothetical protein n=1 Tax=Parachlamydia sp. AcF125 TaxID=2795736 RepID=UPI001BC96A94|nr:hypothetical protein [Parachlamydia sp. AcF125]